MLEYLRRLQVACETGKIPGDVARWLQSGLGTYIKTGQALDACLGLAGPGQESVTRRFLRSERNRFLCLAIQSAGIDCPLPEKIIRTSKLVVKMESRIWPIHRSRPELPEKYSDTEKYLFRAFQTGLDVPFSTRQLNRIVKDQWT